MEPIQLELPGTEQKTVIFMDENGVGKIMPVEEFIELVEKMCQEKK